MKLYKDIKKEQEQLEKEAADRGMIGNNKEIVVVYEQHAAGQILKAAAWMIVLLCFVAGTAVFILR